MLVNPSFGCAFLGCVFLGCVFLGCAGTPSVVTAALEQDLEAYQLAVKTHGGSSKNPSGSGFDEETAHALALAVLRRELSAPAPGLEFETRNNIAPCVGLLGADLLDVALGTGEGAVAAQWLLAPSEWRLEPSQWLRAHPELPVTEPSALDTPAVKERLGLLSEGNEEARRRAIVGERVRLSSYAVADLLEVARLDPSKLNQDLAIATLGSIGGSDVSFGLADIWSNAHPDEQLAILNAWFELPTYRAGGDVQLIRIAEQQLSEHVLAAALLLAQRNNEPPGLAQNVLRGAIAGDDSLLHLKVLRAAEPSIRALVLAEGQHLLTSSADLVAALALHRFAEVKPLSSNAKDRLSELLAVEDPEVLHWARLAQGETQTPREAKPQDALVVAEMRKAPQSRRRVNAALSLLHSHGAAFAAPALADDSPVVRTELACQILLQNTASQ